MVLTDAAKFFASWKILVPGEAVLNGPLQLDAGHFAAFAQSFAPAFRAHQRNGSMANIWRSAAGIGHGELRNSQVLRWILDSNGDHGRGSAILEGLVTLAGEQRPLGFTAAEVRGSVYRTRTEVHPLGGAENRVDIEVASAKFLIFIEVKVRSGESGDQLPRYVDDARIKAAGRPRVVIYLTPDGRRPHDKELHDEIVSVSWKQVASILEAHVDNDASESFSGQLFRQFAKHIRLLK